MKSKSIGDHQPYLPTDVEHLANIVTHGSCVLPSLLGFHLMLQQASTNQQTISVYIYGISLTALFSISTVFHVVVYTGRFRYLKDILHRCDRAVIYLFIAASYTPWLMLKHTDAGFVAHANRLVWLFAGLGIVYQQVYHERYKWLEILFYVLFGVGPAFVIFKTEWPGFHEMLLGGCVCISGIYFFKSDGRIACAHAIWHLFVATAAIIQYYAVWKYLLGEQNVHK